MNAQTNAIATAARIIGRRVPGPFRETGGTPGDRESFRLDKAARVYMGLRRFRNVGAREALERAAFKSFGAGKRPTSRRESLSAGASRRMARHGSKGRRTKWPACSAPTGKPLDSFPSRPGLSVKESETGEP